MGPQEQSPVPQPTPEPQPQITPPQPFMQPMAPQQPYGTQQFGTNPGPVPGMQPKPKKGLIIGLVAGGATLLLLIVGIIVAVVLLGPPSKADYQNAYVKAESLVTKYNTFSASDTFTNDLKNATSDSDVDTAVNKIKAEYDKDNTELAGMKALNDKEVKDAFNAYMKKYDAAFPYLKNMLKGYVVYKNVTDKCTYTAISTITFSIKDRQAATSDYDTRAKPCVDLLNTYKDSSNTKVADFAKAYLAYIQKMRTYVGDYADAYGKGSYTSSDRPSISDLPYSSTIIDSSSSNSYDFSSAFDDFVGTLSKKK